MSVLFSALGLLVLVIRLSPAIFMRLADGASAKTDSVENDARVSVIIPARNEEANLQKILNSLLRLPFFEIIVVDDSSTDRTQEIAQSFAARENRIRVHAGAPKPQGWTGKNWACQQGALTSTGNYLLFTDADTEHCEGSLSRTLQLNADLVSALPFHQSANFFERLLGPFHLLVFISSSAFSRPKTGSLFAIGQYLLFKREWYFQQGMHEAIKQSFADDLDLAERCVAQGGVYKVETSGRVFKVRMYLSLVDFLAGWRRIFRVGFGHASFVRVFEIFFVIACLTESFKFARATPIETLFALSGLLVLGLAQKRYGNFSWLGALLAPLGIGIFVFVSATALWDRILRRDLRWRGRSYKLSS